MANSKMIANAISAVLTLVIAGDVFAAANESSKTMEMAPVKGMDRCFGIAKAHQNDCGTATHSCAGEAKIDGDKQEWILMPTGLCNKIVGGSTTKPA